jgi:hypothetical protein
MFRPTRSTTVVTAFLWAFITGPAGADVVLDQSNVVPAGSTADLAIVTVQSLAGTFTVGVDGVLAQVDLQIYKNTGTTGDLVFTIRPTNDGVPDPDDALVLLALVISLDDMPTIDDPFQEVPLTSIDVSAAGIIVASGDVLALSLSREGAGSPPWATWRHNGDVYDGGSSFKRADSTQDWTPIPDLYAGFQTWVDTGE